MSNDKKSEALGMSYGKAGHTLRKNIIFALLKKSGLDKCYRCGKPIESVDELSIEHKTNWLNSEDPARYFFDMDNISFSHLDCNISVSKTKVGVSGYKGVTPTASGKFKARVYTRGKSVYTETFDTIEEAAKAYDRKARELFGNKVITNADLGLI